MSDPRRIKPLPVIDPLARFQLLGKRQREGQVIVHVAYTAAAWGGSKIRIWKSTFLCPSDGRRSSRLLFAENIALYPAWSTVRPGASRSFTLIFAPLPASCTAFDLVEDIPEDGGFLVRGITRNETDVYHVTLR